MNPKPRGPYAGQDPSLSGPGYERVCNNHVAGERTHEWSVGAGNGHGGRKCGQQVCLLVDTDVRKRIYLGIRNNNQKTEF